MMSVTGCKAKKDLKARVGQDVSGLFVETSLFGPEFHGDGQYTVVGPSPYKRVWYATVVVKNGQIAQVS